MVFVEIAKGERNKYEFDPDAGGVVLDRTLFASVAYPAEYGFIEGTLGRDDDPLDALVLTGAPTFPGCRIRARPVAMLRMSDQDGPDEKILCVPLRDPVWADLRDLDDVPMAVRREIEHFFTVYKDLEDVHPDVQGFVGRTEALSTISASYRRARRDGAA
ncbi:MAG TPA: inorganic diphosphatase [Actinomycetota bacterium]|nr:inorganic diphosphatase [Actinomycetota bacterium]